MTDHSSLQKEKNNTDIVERLNNTPNWMRATMSWKDCVLTYDRAPFEAAAEITRLREDNKKLSDKAEALRKALRDLIVLESDGHHASENSIEAWERAHAALDATKGTT